VATQPIDLIEEHITMLADGRNVYP